MRLEYSGLILSMLLLALLLSACTPRQISPPTAEPDFEPAVSPAAEPLLADARLALARQDLNRAEASLERAIRIENRNPLLWHTLAQTKYRQGDYPQTIQLCLRSNSLLPKGASLIRENLLLMAEAYHRLGQEERARQMSQQASQL
jgi:tetratricopeptide (TPR) repeat protein